MNFFSKSAILLILLLSSQYLHAQDSLAPVKFRRNGLKVGVSFTVTNYFLSYEHSFTKKFSVGGMASYNDGYFTGFTGTIFTRYYLKAFDQKGFFGEFRGSYSYYNPYVYSGYYFDPSQSPNNYSNRIYYGKHRADIHYWCIGLSAGYKLICNKHLFFEFIGGLHFGKATFGSNDMFFSADWLERIIIQDYVQDAFKTSGPGMPFHFMINFGYAF